MKKILLVALGAFFLSVQTVMATPSSIIRIPSADIQPYGTFHLGVDNNTTMFRRTSDGAHDDATDFGLTAGFLDAGLFQIEGGVDVREPTNKPISFNGKIVLPEGGLGEAMPALVFGGYDIGTGPENDSNIWYGEVAKTVSFMGRFAIGYFAGNDTHLKDKDGNVSNDGFLFSFDRRLPEVNERLWFGIDYQGSKSSYGATSFGFSWAFSENASLLLGFVRYHSNAAPGAGKNTMTWQVDFDF